MTNGEKIKAILKPRTDQIRIYSDWVEIEIQSLSINFSCELSWWNAEYQEPTTKNDLGVDCISRADAIHAVSEALKRTFVEYEDIANKVIGKLPSVTPQEPILDKLRAEILKISSYEGFELGGVKDGYRIAIVNVLDIIDKYKAGSEDKE